MRGRKARYRSKELRDLSRELKSAQLRARLLEIAPQFGEFALPDERRKQLHDPPGQILRGRKSGGRTTGQRFVEQAGDESLGKEKGDVGANSVSGASCCVSQRSIPRLGTTSASAANGSRSGCRRTSASASARCSSRLLV